MKILISLFAFTILVFSNDLGYQRAKTLATLGSGNINIIDKENSDDKAVTKKLLKDARNALEGK